MRQRILPEDGGEKSIQAVFDQYCKAKAADRLLNRECEKINETLTSIGNEERKLFQLEVRKEQLFYDMTRLQDEHSYDAAQKLESKQVELN